MANENFSCENRRDWNWGKKRSLKLGQEADPNFFALLKLIAVFLKFVYFHCNFRIFCGKYYLAIVLIISLFGKSGTGLATTSRVKPIEVKVASTVNKRLIRKH